MEDWHYFLVINDYFKDKVLEKMLMDSFLNGQFRGK